MITWNFSFKFNTLAFPKIFFAYHNTHLPFIFQLYIRVIFFPEPSSVLTILFLSNNNINFISPYPPK